MIVGTLKDAKRVEPLHPKFAMMFEYINSNNLLKAPLGRIELDGDNVFINNVEVKTVAQATQKLEVHREYLDVHVVLEGEERIGWSPLEDLKECDTEYNAEGDYALYTDVPSTFVDLKPGQFAIVYPEDAHAPVIGNGDNLRKLICKVRI